MLFLLYFLGMDHFRFYDFIHILGKCMLDVCFSKNSVWVIHLFGFSQSALDSLQVSFKEDILNNLEL